MIVGALVLVEVTAGITEASMTRKPSMPMHPQLVVDHRHRVAAHLAGAGRVEHGRAGLPQVMQQLVVALHIRAGQDFGTT